MLDKISLNHCLLDAKRIVQFVSKNGRRPDTPFLAVRHACYNFLNNIDFLNGRGPFLPLSTPTEH